MVVQGKKEKVSQRGYFPGKRKRKRKRKTHNSTPHQNQPHIHPRQRHLPPRLPPPPPIEIQPKDPTEAVREPARKQRRDEAEQVVEDGDGLRDDPRGGPEDQDDERPDAEAGPGAFAHLVGAAVEADVDVLGRHVAVDDTCFFFFGFFCRHVFLWWGKGGGLKQW